MSVQPTAPESNTRNELHHRCHQDLIRLLGLEAAEQHPQMTGRLILTMLACAAAPATAFTGPRGAPPRGMRALRMTATSEPPPPTVVLTRARGDNTGLRKLLDDKMIATVELPCVEHYELTGDGGDASAADECTQGSCPDAVGLDALVDELNGSRAASRWAWVVLPSPTAAVTCVREHSARARATTAAVVGSLFRGSCARFFSHRADDALSFLLSLFLSFLVLRGSSTRGRSRANRRSCRASPRSARRAPPRSTRARTARSRPSSSRASRPRRRSARSSRSARRTRRRLARS